ncbi:monovalent cation/H(+) antiporter subunit G [Bacillus sp. FJAT-47783]|uniref:monovalent cation/H(+) antiporter subunit G n=1 Tax=Bacillus sp. FJAT-47783 TaxID=2922712 RepID=UPI001FACC667|nr:monovalent cation/H(+) antiporter subunit G [Bacillus sp. FJAT-47783]
MIVISKLIIGFLILLGSILSLISSIGILRLPDVYTRNHAASKAATLGIISIMLGVFLYFSIHEEHINTRVILGIIFVLLTSPVAGHLINRAAYYTKTPLWKNTVVDDLKNKEEG